MGRFDRTDTAGSGIPPSLGTAADELRSQVERQVREIVESAEKRAQQIEDAALRRARESEIQAQRRTRELLATAEEHASRLLASLGSLEGEIGRAVAAMRRDTEALVGEIRSAIPAQESVPSDSELREELLGPLHDQPLEADGADAPAASQPPASEEMVREHVMKMRDAGRSRTQAARSLLELGKERDYLAMLDEVYPEEPDEPVGDTGRRRGLLRRRRPPQPYAVEDE